MSKKAQPKAPQTEPAEDPDEVDHWMRKVPTEEEFFAEPLEEKDDDPFVGLSQFLQVGSSILGSYLFPLLPKPPGYMIERGIYVRRWISKALDGTRVFSTHPAFRDADWHTAESVQHRVRLELGTVGRFIGRFIAFGDRINDPAFPTEAERRECLERYDRICDLVESVRFAASGGKHGITSKPNLSVPMQKKTMAGKLGITVRGLNDLIDANKCRVEKIGRKTFQMDMDTLTPAQRKHWDRQP